MRFKIHSISDIITNSSSETFCFIYSEDISKVLKVLSPYFGNYDVFDECCAQIYGPFQEGMRILILKLDVPKIIDLRY